MKDINIMSVVNDILDDHNLTRLQRHASTYGGAYVAPCPRCKQLTGNGGEDRLVVWPERPAYGEGSRENPCFKCGQCKDDRGRVWSGDLVAFVRGTKGYSYGEALSFLGIDSAYATRPREVHLVPQLSVTGAPSQVWQKRALEITQEAIETLWSDMGKSARNYLMGERGLKEDILRKHCVGFLAQERFEEGELWGLEGKLVLPRGIVFPELHTIMVDNLPFRECWAVSIRLPNADILLKKLQGLKVGKYHQVRGGNAGLYNAESITPEKPHVMTESQVDTLSIEQEAGFEFASTATQSAYNGRNVLWQIRVLEAPFTMFGMDADNAGKAAYEVWSKVIPPEKLLHWMPKNGDWNTMLQNEEAILDFLRQGRDMYYSFLSPLKIQEAIVSLVDEPVPPTSDSIIAIETPRVFDADIMCDECKEVISTIPKPFFGALLCETCYDKKNASKTVRFGSGEDCGASESDFVYRYKAYTFPQERFASVQLLEYGERVRWERLIYPAGKGLVSAVRGEWKNHSGGVVPGGEKYWAEFAYNAPVEEVWSAAYLARMHSKGEYPKPEKVIAHPCARVGCGHDGEATARLRFTRPKDEHGRELMSKGYLYPEDSPKRQLVNGQWIYWCPRCISGFWVLQIGKYLDFPLFEMGISTETLPAGVDNWLKRVTHSSEYANVCRFDALRKKYPDIWSELAATIQD